MNRTRPTPNANSDRIPFNLSYTPETGWFSWKSQRPKDLGLAFKERIDDFTRRGGVVRKDSVIAIELMLSASPDFFKRADAELGKKWIRANTEWLKETFGEKNLVQAALHLDETTPHIHAFVVPEIQMVETRGRKPKNPQPDAAPKMPKPALAASHWLDGRAKLGELQDRYASAMEHLGLERGLKGSGASHKSVRSYYAAAEAYAAKNASEGNLSVNYRPPEIKIPEPVNWFEKAFGKITGTVPEKTAKQIAQEAAMAAAKIAEAEARKAAAAARQYAHEKWLADMRLQEIGGREGLNRLLRLEEELKQQELNLKERLKLEVQALERFKDQQIHQLENLCHEREQQLETLARELEFAQADSAAERKEVAELRHEVLMLKYELGIEVEEDSRPTYRNTQRFGF